MCVITLLFVVTSSLQLSSSRSDVYQCLSSTLYGVQSDGSSDVRLAADSALTRLSHLGLVDTVTYDDTEALTLTVLGTAVYRGR